MIPILALPTYHSSSISMGCPGYPSLQKSPNPKPYMGSLLAKAGEQELLDDLRRELLRRDLSLRPRERVRALQGYIVETVGAVIRMYVHVYTCLHIYVYMVRAGVWKGHRYGNHKKTGVDYVDVSFNQ